MKAVVVFVVGLAAMLVLGRVAHAQQCVMDDNGIYQCTDPGNGGGTPTSGGGNNGYQCSNPWCTEECAPYLRSSCGFTRCGPQACWINCPAHPGFVGNCYDQAVNCAAAQACVTGWPVLTTSGYWVDCENYAGFASNGQAVSADQYYQEVCLSPGYGWTPNMWGYLQ